MEDLLPLIKASKFVPPDDSFGGELYQMITYGLDKKGAQNEWAKMGRSDDSFRKTFKKLKDNVVREVAVDYQKSKLKPFQKERLECWERYQKFKSMMVLEKRSLAIKMAEETIRLAEKCGFTEIVYSLSLELEHHYGAMDVHFQRYKRYRKLSEISFHHLNKERGVQSLFTEVVLHYRKGKKLNHLAERLDKIQKDQTGTYKYMLFRCNTLTIQFFLNGNFNGVVREIKHTLNYLTNSNILLPNIVKTNLFNQLLPVLIGQKRFAEAEEELSNCLKLTIAGSYNWHLLMLQKAYLGFYNNKPLLALEAWQEAAKKRKHNTPLVEEMWYIVRAYLEVFEKSGKITVGKPFRLGKFLNSTHISRQDKSGDNVAIIIAELLLLLFTGKRQQYMQRVDTLPTYLHNHLRNKNNIRSKCFLQMLKKVEEGDYHLARINPRIKRWKNQLSKNPRVVLSSSEIVPYEKLWEMVCSRLK